MLYFRVIERDELWQNRMKNIHDEEFFIDNEKLINGGHKVFQVDLS